MSVQFGEKLGWVTSLGANDSSPRETVGIRRVELSPTGGRKIYTYVKNGESATAFADGEVIKWDNAGTGVAKRAGAAGDLICGVAIGVITAGNYGWVQVYGLHSAIKSAASTAAGDAIIAAAAATGGRVAKNTAPTHQVVAWATAARNDTANTNAGFIVAI